MSVESHPRIVNALPTVGPSLARDHARLDALFVSLEEGSAADVDTRTLGRLWRNFEDGLLRHMEAEETYVFGAMQESHADLLAELRATHERIRALLDELDVAVDLHFVRHPQVKDLLTTLRAHAAKEDETIYRWADSFLTDTEKKVLIDALRQAEHDAAA